MFFVSRRRRHTRSKRDWSSDVCSSDLGGWAASAAAASMSIAIEPAGLSETQRQIVELAREFARTRIEPFAAEWDRTAHFARDVIDALGELGFLGMCAPEEYDGMGLDTVTYLL